MALRKRPIAFVHLMMLAVHLYVAAHAGEIRLVGSDLLGRELPVALHRYAAERAFSVAVTFDGSRPALEQLKSGRAQVGLVTLPDGEGPNEADFASRSIAWHRVVVLVASANPLDRATVGELAAVFGTGVGSGYNRWGDLGLGDDWSGSPISALAPMAGAGMTAEFFRHAVLGGHPLKSQVIRYASPADLVDRLTADRRVMALAGNRPKNSPEVKVLNLAVRTGEPAFPPTPDNIVSGDYPLRLPLRLVYRRDAESGLSGLLAWLWSDEVAEIFGRADLVPLPASARQQQAQMLEKNKEKKLRK